MLRLLSLYSRQRTAWFLLLISAIALEMIALYFQHVMMLLPCVLCIYQRCAIFGIGFAGLLGFVMPKSFIVRVLAIGIWLYSAAEGFLTAYRQVRLQFEPSLFDSCPLTLEFPSWLPLDKWLPFMFEATGSCSLKIWQFLTIEMSQWALISFGIYFLVGAFVLVSQFFSPTKQSIFK